MGVAPPPTYPSWLLPLGVGVAIGLAVGLLAYSEWERYRVSQLDSSVMALDEQRMMGVDLVRRLTENPDYVFTEQDCSEIKNRIVALQNAINLAENNPRPVDSATISNTQNTLDDLTALSSRCPR